MRVLFATAELAPFVKVGGLGDATAGLVGALERQGISVEVVLPDYGGLVPEEAETAPLEVPAWAGPTTVTRGRLPGLERVALVAGPAMARPHPYTDATGKGWPDNDARFFSFSAAVAALAALSQPDLLHLNDWHTGASLGLLIDPPPSVLTIHNPAYQGWADGSWLARLVRRPEAYEWYGGTNPLSGAIALADKVVTVSPTFAAEALRAESGFGLDGPLAARGADFVGILNGIDTEVWDPATDRHLPVTYDADTPSRKRELARRLARELGWEPNGGPLIGMVTRLTDQKGVDLALDAARSLSRLGARMIMLGTGEAALAERARAVAKAGGDRFLFHEGYDEALSHRIFGAADLYLMPSRFEPCGLAQMQAMRYGAIPVVTAVGGLRDTVIDADAEPDLGTGFVAPSPTASAVAAALERAVVAWRSTRRRGEIRRRAMTLDWSWGGPARHYLELYREVTSAR